MNTGQFQMTVTLDVLDAIRKAGRISVMELALQLDRPEYSVQRSVRKLRDKKMVYVSGHVLHPPGTAGRPTPLYSVGDKKDVVHNAMTKNQRAAAYGARNRALIRTKARVVEGRKFNFWSGLK